MPLRARADSRHRPPTDGSGSSRRSALPGSTPRRARDAAGDRLPAGTSGALAHVVEEVPDDLVCDEQLAGDATIAARRQASRTARRHPGASRFCVDRSERVLDGASDRGSPRRGVRQRVDLARDRRAVPTAARGLAAPSSAQACLGSSGAGSLLSREAGYFPSLEDRVDRKHPIVENRLVHAEISPIRRFSIRDGELARATRTGPRRPRDSPAARRSPTASTLTSAKLAIATTAPAEKTIGKPVTVS